MDLALRARLRAGFAEHPIVAPLDDAARDSLWSAGRLTPFTPGQHLSREGDDVDFYWLLLRGIVRVYYTSTEGFEVTVKIFAAPAAWAEMQILTNHRHTEDCVCVEDAWALCIPKAFFARFLDQHPAFMRQVLVDTSARFLIATQHERALAFLTVPERLAHLLLSYVRVYGVEGTAGVRIRAKLSHEQLAADLGVVKKSITRTLSQWTEEGVVVKDGIHYLIPDLARLVERSPKGLIGVDWSTGTKVQAGQVDDDDDDVARRR
ncbi:MAG: Crp/Fnr family transcriptional regulator [Deltaproteobacteria bacterium]|nr:Crp/Fnr family transcriptional regulator [Deltaproteobacteria bacterium]